VGLGEDTPSPLAPAHPNVGDRIPACCADHGCSTKLVEDANAGYDQVIGLDLSEVAVAGSLDKPGAVGGTGPSKQTNRR
jgi:hypothetical protein